MSTISEMTKVELDKQKYDLLQQSQANSADHNVVRMNPMAMIISSRIARIPRTQRTNNMVKLLYGYIIIRHTVIFIRH